MNIAIIEDLQLDYEILRDVLNDYAFEQNTLFDLKWFSSSEAFLTNFSSDTYDLLFFDILLGDGMTGIDAARTVRQMGSNTSIVFTTSERDFAVDSYEVQAIDYLVKPYEPKRICEVVTRVLNVLQTKHYLNVSVGRETRCICSEDIMWAEARDHYMELHMQSGENLLASMRFSDLLKDLPSQPQFQCCYRGVIINLEYADALQENNFLLRDGTKVPISRLKRAEMQKCLSDYAIFNTRKEMGL